jgi:hypothetical protein
MPSTVAHGTSASWLAVTLAHVQPDDTSHLLAAIISATIVDLDHLIYIVRDRESYKQRGFAGYLHNARSPFHEMFGLLVVGILAAVMFTADQKLALVVFLGYSIHLVQDWLIGKSHPLAPVDRTEVVFYVPSLKQKIILDIVLVVVFGALWILYLRGRV